MRSVSRASFFGVASPSGRASLSREDQPSPCAQCHSTRRTQKVLRAENAGDARSRSTPRRPSCNSRPTAKCHWLPRGIAAACSRDEARRRAV
eukprot:5761170-Prymnesium_polylepis.1